MGFSSNLDRDVIECIFHMKITVAGKNGFPGWLPILPCAADLHPPAEKIEWV